MERKSGILMPVFSLPSEYGIGDFGKGGYKFAEFLKKSGQRVWQTLPLVQTGFGNSPYSTVCSYSYNPYFISPEILVEKRLVTLEEADFCKTDGKIADYGFLYNSRFPMLRRAYSRFDKKDKEFLEFKAEKRFYGYALYMALKYASGQKHFYEWEDGYKYRDEKALKTFAEDYAEELDFWQYVQFEAKRQWRSLKKYVNSLGIEIFGDLPLYPALDSVDVWENKDIFKLDGNFVPVTVAGVPPDYFSESGQLWGNPVYDYDRQKKDGFSWWKKRVAVALEDFDLIRIDHFRGLDRFYEIPYGDKDAKHGKWTDVPSDELFAAVSEVSDKSRIIAEDLGIIDDGVRSLLKKTGYAGMKVLLFAFNGESENPYLPEKITENSVCYTGTHDNDTLMGYLSKASEWDKNNFKNGVKNSLNKLGLTANAEEDKELCVATIRLGLSCKAKLFIAPLQDYLFMGNEMRINEPSTVKENNWAVRFSEVDFSEENAQRIKELCVEYNRIR